jgi:hypothetical protein
VSWPQRVCLGQTDEPAITIVWVIKIAGIIVTIPVRHGRSRPTPTFTRTSQGRPDGGCRRDAPFRALRRHRLRRAASAGTVSSPACQRLRRTVRSSIKPFDAWEVAHQMTLLCPARGCTEGLERMPPKGVRLPTGETVTGTNSAIPAEAILRRDTDVSQIGVIESSSRRDQTLHLTKTDLIPLSSASARVRCGGPGTCAQAPRAYRRRRRWLGGGGGTGYQRPHQPSQASGRSALELQAADEFDDRTTSGISSPPHPIFFSKSRSVRA